GQKLRNSSKRQLVARIRCELQICGYIFDMRLFEKSHAARDGKRNLLPGQFELQFERVKVGAIKDRHFIEADSFFMQLAGALSNKESLLGAIFAHHERGAIT